MYQLETLKNGLKLLSVPFRETEAVCVLVLVKVGSKYEKKELNGISHFLEHMLFKGTKKRPTQKEVAEVLDKIGGIYNGFTSEEYTGYWAKVAKQHLEIAIEWVADIFLNSLIPESEVAKEKKVIIEEINMYEDNPPSVAQRLWKKLLYGQQPAGWEVIGTKTNIRRMTQEKILNFMKTHYHAANTLISIAGNFQPEKGKRLIEKYFAKIKKGTPAKKPLPKERQTKPKLLLYNKQTQQTHLCLGVRAFSLLDKKRYALEIISQILGGMMSSRLFIELRDKRGLGYYLSTQYEADPDLGYLVTRTGVDHKRTKEAVKIILEEYKKIKKELVPKDELLKTKEYLKGRLALSLESSDSQAFFYGVQYILKGKIERPKEIYSHIDKVTREEIRRVAQEIFVPQKLNLVIVGPHKEKQKFKNLLFEF